MKYFFHIILQIHQLLNCSFPNQFLLSLLFETISFSVYQIHLFFALFEHPEMETGKVQAQVILEKKTGLFALHFILAGEVEVICGWLLRSGNGALLVTFGLFIFVNSLPTK